jgi:hypothetical protein
MNVNVLKDQNHLNIAGDSYSPSANIKVTKSPRTSPLHRGSSGYMSDGSTGGTVPLEGLELLSNPKKVSHSISDDDDVIDMGLDDIAMNDDEMDEDGDDEMSLPPVGFNGTLSSDEEDDEESVVERPKTYEEIMTEKQEYLFKLDRLEKQGYRVSRKYTLASNLDDIRYEYDRIKRQRDVEKSIRMYRKGLMAVTSGIEYLNKKFDPLDVKLDGWSESQMENISDYDEVFEELHDKYSDSIQMAPELKLLFMVGGSAFMFHLTNTLFKTAAPSLEEVLKRNPELMRNLSQATLNTMGDNMGVGAGNPMFNMMSKGINMSSDARTRPSAMPPPAPRAETAGRTMKGPSGVDDILSSLGGGPSRGTRERDSSAINIEF